MSTRRTPAPSPGTGSSRTASCDPPAGFAPGPLTTQPETKPGGPWPAGLNDFEPEQRRVLLLAGVAAFFSAYGGSVLFYALPAVAHDFNARLQGLANLGSLLALGALLALPLAALADRVGRRRVLAAGVLAFSLADIASAFTTDLSQLAATRFVAVCFEELATALAAVMVVEAVPAQHRAIANAALAVAAGLGLGLTTLLYPIAAPHWRLVYLPAVLGIPAAAWLWLRLPEGRAWEHLRERSPLRALAAPLWRRRLLLLAASGFLGALLYEPVTLFSAFYGSRQLGLSPATISAVVALSSPLGGLGFLLGGWLSDRKGRRTLGVVLSLAAAVTDALTFSGGLLGFWAGSVVSAMAVGALAPILAAWTGELMPTRGRATGETFAVIAGGLGGALGLQVFARLQPAISFSGAALAALVVALAGALVLALLPETGGQPLAE